MNDHGERRSRETGRADGDGDIARDGTDLTVTWDEPDNTGPDITGYRLECTGTDVPDDQCPMDLVIGLVDTDEVGTHTITELTADKSYRVRLRAENDEGDGAWSSWETQSTNKEGNTLPTFTTPPENSCMWQRTLLLPDNRSPRDVELVTDW